MTPQHHDDLLPIDSQHARVFRCPGEAAPVSESVHLARVASGWHGCRDCVWNPSAPPAGDPRTAIRRTANGVRGGYLNAIDRFRAAQLASIFSSHMARVVHVRSAVRAEDTAVSLSGRVGVAIGYDQREGDQDIFAGVVSAVLQNGCDVWDVGECTTASLLEFGRRAPVAGCLMVTGAGGRPGDVGLDAFSRDGRSLSVPWTDFGVGLRVLPVSSGTPTEHHEPTEDSPQAQLAETSARRSAVVRPTNRFAGSLNTLADSEAISVLQLPELGQSMSLFRNGRTSGTLHSVATEEPYRQWLARWWPKQGSAVMRFAAQPRVRQRISSLLPATADVEFCRTEGDRTEGDRTASVDRTTISIPEDDRFAHLTTRRGRDMTAEELAEWINRASRNTVSHVTAHPSQDGTHVLLVDVADPTSGQSHEIISDGLAVAGLVLTLLQNKKNRLPA